MFEDVFNSEPEWDSYTYHADQERFKLMYTVYPGRKEVGPSDLVTGKFGELITKSFGREIY